MDKKTQHIHNAINLIRSQHSGILSTISLSLKGFPFGSITPFLMTESGDIVIYASDIAQHARNMKSNDKVSLFVHDSGEKDSQAGARVTIVGNAISDGVDTKLQAQYFALFPQAKAYIKAHDFRFYLLKTHKVRYIGGFGEIYWFSQTEFSDALYPKLGSTESAIAHMHADHADALAQIVTYHERQYVEEGSVSLLSCTAHGFHYRCDKKGQHITEAKQINFVPFIRPLSDDYDLRHAFVDLTKRARVDIQSKRSTETKVLADLE